MKVIALLLSVLASASAFAVTGARVAVPARAATKMMDSTMVEVGANSLAYIQTSMDGSGGTQVFVTAAIGATSIVFRNGKDGLSPSSGGWDTESGALSPAAIPFFAGPIALLALKATGNI